MYRFHRLFPALIFALALAPAQAEVLLIETLDAGAAVEVPASGVTKETVRQHYGEPREVIPAVGEPPITRWIYDDFTVFFEFDRVIHTVDHRSKP